MYLINVSNYAGALIWSTITLMREMAVAERIMEYAEITDLEELEGQNIQDPKYRSKQID